MFRAAFVALAVSLGLAACAGEPPDDPSITALLHGLTVIDGTGATPVPKQTVALAGSRIAYIGDAAQAPRSSTARVYDLDGRWAMPGLIDMHAHLDGGRYAQRFLAQLVAFGTTTLRAPSNPNTELRERVESGEFVGPQLFLSGVLINGPESFFGQRGETAQGYRDIVAADAERGVEFVKLYVGVPPDLARVVIEEAHSRGLRVIGHLGETSWTEAAQAGIDALTHGWFAGLAHDLVPLEHRERFRGFYIPAGPIPFDAGLFGEWRELVDPRGPEVVALADLLASRRIVVDPTLVLGEAIIWGDDSITLERLEPDLAMPGQAESWREGHHPYSRSWTAEQRSQAKLAWPQMLEIVRVFHERGVFLTTGTDYLNPWMTPGVALHRELELLVSAGISSMDVLTMATRNGAEALGILEEAGTIEVGKRADLLILTANPLDDVANTRRIEYVFLRGQSFAPATLMGQYR